MNSMVRKVWQWTPVVVLWGLVVGVFVAVVLGAAGCPPTPPPTGTPVYTCVELGCTEADLVDPTCLLTGALCDCRTCRDPVTVPCVPPAAPLLARPTR